jgi:tetratricopeptide (TPR) repeat protein
MKFHPPKQKAVPQNLFDIYNEAVIGAYRFQDMMLERTMDLVDDDTTIIVMSDHGFESGHRRILKMPKYPAAPALEHRQFGIFVAAGPNIKKNEKVFGLGLIDIAPTILHMFNLPIGKDMDGNVALDIFKEIKTPKYIESWETVEGDFGQHQNTNDTDQLGDQETMDQLIELGYIERPDQKIEHAVLKTKCDLKHNLARVYLGKKGYELAKDILLELANTDYPVYKEEDIIKQHKQNRNQKSAFKVGDSIIDIIPYYMDLLTISLAEKDFEKAEEYLMQLRTRDKKFEINTYFAESKILLGKGKVHEALKVLNKAKNNKPNSEVWYQIGKIYMQLTKYEEAKKAFENALEFEIDKAKFHQALAVVLLRLGDFELAAEHALTSIELVKYFPEAHYTLGEALEKLGDLENAKMAFETAARLKPKTHPRAEKALENINEKNSDLQNYQDKSQFKYRKEQIVIVSGLPRSGTSLMMQMLNEGGLQVLTDDNRKADISNPKGYFEYDSAMSIHKDNSWLELAKDKSVDLTEIIKSQQKMIGKDPETLPMRLFDAYNKQLNQVEMWKNKEPGVELVYLDYKKILNNTDESLNKLISFIGVDMNKKAMAKCVDRSLYRNRV